MQGNRGKLRNQIRGDRDGGRPCAHARAGNPDDERERDGEDNQEHNGKGNIQGVPANQERNTVGWESVDKRILREHGGAIREQGCDSKVHPEPWERCERVRENPRIATRIRLRNIGEK